MRAKNIGKYLKQYAEPEIQALENFPAQYCFSHVVIVPAYNETAYFAKHFYKSSLVNESALMIIVINQPDHDNNHLPQSELKNNLISLGDVAWQNDTLTLIELSQGNSFFLVVDRFTKPIPEKLGVGLARKIAADLALSLFHQKKLSSRWILSTDADVELPSNYFSALQSLANNTVAACYNFYHHCQDDKINQANVQYEQALRYYVAGLKFAGSSYAYFTIGSTIAIDCGAYATVRGFPKRSAGEDFYLLNKTAKLGPIAFIKSSTLKIGARLSDRVPFGTGPAVYQIMKLAEEGKPYCYYHPEIFDELKVCLSAFDLLWINRMSLDLWHVGLSDYIKTALEEIGFYSFLNKHLNDDEKQFNKQLTVWFDAFKTLKFIHAIRKQGVINIPLKLAVEQAKFGTDTR